MNRQRSTAILIVLIVVGGIIGGVFYVQRSIQNITVKLKESPFVSLGVSNVTVLFEFQIENPTLLSAHVVDLPFSVELANYPLGTGSVTVPILIPSNGRTETTGRIQIPYSQIPSVTVAALREYLRTGTLKYRVSGTATFRILMFDIIVPFDLTGDVLEALGQTASLSQYPYLGTGDFISRFEVT